MLHTWFTLIKSETAHLKKDIPVFKHARLLAIFMRLTGCFLFISALLASILDEKVTLLARIGMLWIGMLLTAIAKSMLIMLKTQTARYKLATAWFYCCDILAYSIGSGFLLSLLFPNDLEQCLLGALVITILILIIRRYYNRNDTYRSSLIYFALVFFPYYLLVYFAPQSKKLLLSIISISATFILTLILFALNIADLVVVLNPFPAINMQFIALLITLLVSDKVALYILPKTSLQLYWQHKNMSKIVISWGMVTAMVLFYALDWKLLMNGIEGWSDARNNILWSFTTYRLLTGLLDYDYTSTQKES